MQRVRFKLISSSKMEQGRNIINPKALGLFIRKLGTPFLDLSCVSAWVYVFLAQTAQLFDGITCGIVRYMKASIIGVPMFFNK